MVFRWVLWFLYNVVWCLLSPVFLGVYTVARLRREVTPEARRHFLESLTIRLGLSADITFLRALRDGPLYEKTLWLHAVSLGETVAVWPVVTALLTQQPTWRIVLTTTTLTGQRVAQDRRQILPEALQSRLLVTYAPVDLPWRVWDFLQAVRPDVLLVMETERWPNMLTLARWGARMPVVQLNARISPKSFAAMRPWAWLLRPLLLDPLSATWVQSAEDQARFESLGVPAHQLQALGQLKYGVLPTVKPDLKAQLLSWTASAGRRWVCGSVHPVECDALVAAWQQIRQADPTALALWVPRHPEKAAVFEAALNASSIPVYRRSEHQANEAIPPGAVFLIDTIGELHTAYSVADAALVGGSLDASLGGHNPLEPLFLNIPTAVGPHTGTFQGVVNQLTAMDLLTVLPVDTPQAAATAMAGWWRQQCQNEHRQRFQDNLPQLAVFSEVLPRYTAAIEAVVQEGC